MSSRREPKRSESSKRGRMKGERAKNGAKGKREKLFAKMTAATGGFLGRNMRGTIGSISPVPDQPTPNECSTSGQTNKEEQFIALSPDADSSGSDSFVRSSSLGLQTNRLIIYSRATIHLFRPHHQPRMIQAEPQFMSKTSNTSRKASKMLAGPNIQPP